MFAFSYYTMLSVHDLILSIKLFFILLFFVLLGFLSFRFFIFSIFLLFTIYLLFHTHICIFNHVISLSSHIVVSANKTQVNHPPTICKYINRHRLALVSTNVHFAIYNVRQILSHSGKPQQHLASVKTDKRLFYCTHSPPPSLTSFYRPFI